MIRKKIKIRRVYFAIKREQIDVSDVDGHMIVLIEARGISTNMEGEAFNDGWSVREVAVIDINSKLGNGFGHGYLEETDADGDKVYTRWEGEDVRNTGSGRWSYIKGTGKFEGIKGEGNWSSYVLSPTQWYVDSDGEIELSGKNGDF